ncbi:HAD-IIIC family phosphatase [Xenorhabdus hominickii]|uniref:Capsular biosynthesis protein n=1 Tax=Xenorhabdus hominickii TaxID=351679 RepID=A0A2G0QEQ0_XENHO|nr:HAD-IIIC family phosphatase [Xenorhabdus hominickii]AOM41724.1 capsular biosynthesis protein [Xenorhabdus hominickii]PHM57681.1 capsular biosynthesis protein [Xenorhabdus hominickii]
MKNLIVDLDSTLTLGDSKDYKIVSPRKDIINKLLQYKEMGFKITIFTARNMRTYEGNIGKINIHTLPIIIKWLDKHNVPYDEILVGKPWCGNDGFYIDDKAIRPSEFSSLSYPDIIEILNKEKQCF